MSKFTPTRQPNPCLICGDISGKCRQSQDNELHLCMIFSDSRLGEIQNGYKCVKTNSKGWTSWKIDNSQEWTAERKANWEREREQRRVVNEKKRQEAIAKELPPLERHNSALTLLSQLHLDNIDQADLLARGFTEEQIAADGYKSVSQWQQVERLPPNFPGLLPNGRLNAYEPGYLCPIRNIDDLIVGYQIRLRNVKSGGRYRWLTSATKKHPNGATPHVNGELPLAVFESKGFEKPKFENSIWLTEGVGSKPSLTRYRLGVPVIGSAGGLFSSSPNTTKSTLQKLSAKYQTKQLIVAVDAGDVSNPQVFSRYQNQFEFLQGLGYEIQIAWWNQVLKTDCDIDELDPSRFADIQLISVDEFCAIAYTEKSEPKEESESKPRINWVGERENRCILTPNITMSKPKFRLLSSLPKSNAIIAIKSGLGTGKTEAILKRINANSKGVRLIGHRNNLLFQTIQRGNEIGVQIYHLREDGGKDLVADEQTSLAFCLDSILHVDGYFEGMDIYIDETVSVLFHAVSGGTLGENQAKILKAFNAAIEKCNNVYLLDGNLTDIQVELISKLAPNKRVIKILNAYKSTPHTIKFIEGVDAEKEIKKRDKSPLIKQMVAEGGRPWICTDSLERSKILDTILKGFEKWGYVLNSETAGEDWAKEFLKDPNQFIRKYQPDYIIISPTAESGISVTINDYFTAKFSFFVGVLGTSSQHQMMFRLRDSSIPHYVFCPERSMVKDRSNPTTYFLNEYKKALSDRAHLSMDLVFQDSENYVATFGRTVMEAALERSDPRWENFACQMGCLDNIEMDNLRECLIGHLKAEGHNVTVEKLEISPEFQKIEKEAKEENQITLAKELFEAVPFDSIEEAKEEKKKSPNKHQLRRIEKTFWLDKTPGIDRSEHYDQNFVVNCWVKDKKFIANTQRYWFLNNPRVSAKKHECDWYYKATQEDFFIASVTRSSYSVIRALQDLGIEEFITKFSNQEYHKDSPEVLAIVKKMRDRKDIQTALNRKPKAETATGKEILETIGWLLSLVGYKNQFQGKRMIDGIRFNTYTCAVDLPAGVTLETRDVILDAIARKMTAWMDSEKSQVNWVGEPADTEVKKPEEAMEVEVSQPELPTMLTEHQPKVPTTNHAEAVVNIQPTIQPTIQPPIPPQHPLEWARVGSEILAKPQGREQWRKAVVLKVANDLKDFWKVWIEGDRYETLVWNHYSIRALE